MKQKERAMWKAVVGMAVVASLGTGWADEDLDELKNEVGSSLSDLNARMDGLEKDLKAMKVKLAGYTQYKYTAGQTDGGKQAFDFERVRIAFSGKLADWAEFKLQPDFGKVDSGGSAVLREAYVHLKFHDAVQFRIGQYHQPFGHELTYSSSSKKVFDAPKYLKSVMLDDYDYGAQWWGNLPGSQMFSWRVALLLGTANTTTENNTKKDAGVQVRSLVMNDLEIGASVYSGYAGAAETARTSYGIHIKYETKAPFPLYVTGEYIGGKDSAGSKDVMDAVLTGEIQPFGDTGIAPTLRVEMWDKDTGTASDEETYIVPALNWYFPGSSVRLLVDVVLKTEIPSKDDNKMNVMLQIKY